MISSILDFIHSQDLFEAGVLTEEAYHTAVGRVKVQGSGSVAVGPGARSVGPAGIMVGGNVDGNIIIQVTEAFWQQYNTPTPNADELRSATEAYLQYLINRYQFLELKGMGVTDRIPLRMPLLELYVPLKGRIELPKGETWSRNLFVAGRTLTKGEAENIGERVSEPLPIMPQLQKHSGLVILGDPGAGKTTFMKYVALQLATGQGKEVGLENRLPILIPLSAYANALAENKGRNVPLQTFMATYYEQLGITEPLLAVFEEALKRGGCLILLDGLDEVREPALRQTVVKTVEDFFAYQQQRGNKFVLTSRIVGYREARLSGTDLSECTLVDFDDAEIEQFIDQWTTALERAAHGANEVAQKEADREKEELMRSIVHNQGVRRLASNPLLLTILALMKRQGVVLPERRVELYDNYTKVLLNQWNLARSLGHVSDYTVDVLSTMDILAPLALWMHEINPGVGLVREDDMQAKLREFFQQHEEENPAKAAEKFLKDVRDHANLLLERGAKEYGFIHLTFQEYLAAVAIAQQGQGNVQRIIDQLLPRLRDSNWHEVALLTVGYIGLQQRLNKTAGELLLEMINQAQHDAAEAVIFAGEALLDVGPNGVDIPSRKKIIEILATSVEDDANIRTPNRAAIGRLLGQLGDPRRGVGVRDGLPDIWWGEEVPAGTYMVGDENQGNNPPRQVTIAKPYRLARYPVTQAQFALFEEAADRDDGRWWEGMPADAKQFDKPAFAYANHPRENVSWYQAVAFCRWLNDKLGVGEEEGVRLPHEDEWEVAARYPHGQRRYPWGNEWDSNKANTIESGLRKTTAVGSYPQGVNKALGLYDMSGNVWEWCQNKYKQPTVTAVDRSGDGRVLRGGSWIFNPNFARAVYRNYSRPDSRLSSSGFRLVCPPSLVWSLMGGGA